MIKYRRNQLKGGTYFFTLTLRDRKLRLLVEHFALLRQAMYRVKERKPYEIKAIVVLPDHLHAIWELPEADKDYSGRWRWVKGLFTRGLLEQGYEFQKDGSGEYNVWQRRFWEHTIRDEKDLERHINYIHYNPVKYGLVQKIRD